MMTKTYEHLNSNEDDHLAVLKSEAKSLPEIAKILKQGSSTLSRELKRNAPPVYPLQN
jgi:IS30 family transposase